MSHTRQSPAGGKIAGGTDLFAEFGTDADYFAGAKPHEWIKATGASGSDGFYDPGAFLTASHAQWNLSASFIGPLPAGGMRGTAEPHSISSPLRESSLPVAAGSGEILPGAPGDPITQAQVNQFAQGLAQTLSAVQSNLVNQVFAETLPILGNHLLGAASSGATQLAYVTALKDAIATGLGTLTGSAAYAEAQVESALNSALTGFGTADLNLANPNDIALTFNTAQNVGALSVPIDSHLGLPGIGLTTTGSAQSTLDYVMNFSSGLDANGFYLSTGGGGAAFQITANTTLSGFGAGAELSALKFNATDNAATPTLFNATFNVALKDANNDGHLRVGELGDDLLDATLSGNAAINLHLASDLGTAVLPAIGADLNFVWGFSNAPVIPGDSNTTFGSVPEVGFKNVTLDLGTFFSDFARPVLQTVRDVSAPLQPIIDAMMQPIPVLTNLHRLNPAIPESLLQMAVANGTISQAQADAFNILATLTDISDRVPLDGAGGVQIDLGDFNLGGADPRAAVFELASIIPNSIRDAVSAAAQSPAAMDFLNDLAGFPVVPPGGGPDGQGLKFPILDNPQTAFGLLLGRNVDLFTMDNATQNIALYDLNEFVRLIGPLGIRLQGEGNVRLDLDFGFDTHGLVQFAASGDPSQIFNGFYIKVPTDSAGLPISIAELTADFNAALAVNLILAEAGAGGGLAADINVTLADPNGDLRVHLDEFIDQFNMSPLCVFDADGALTYGLHAYVTVGIGPVSHTETFDGPGGVLANFSFSCLGPDDERPVLAHLDTGDAHLHLGPEAFLRVSGNTADGAEEFIVTHLGGAAATEQIGVSFVTQSESTGALGMLPYGPVNGFIRGDGGINDDSIFLAEDVITPAILSGGAGNDRLTGGGGNDAISGGIGRDVLIGGLGDDSLLGEDGDDLLEGGPGADVLDGGPGYDAVTYAGSQSSVLIDLSIGLTTNDAFGDVFISIEQYESTGFDDTLIGTAGPDVFYAIAGDDVLDGRDGDDLLEGGPGADQLIGGNGFDYASYWRSPVGVQVNLATSSATGGDAAGDTFDGIEGLEGSSFSDTLTGDANPNRIFGGLGRDFIDAGEGDDFVSGGGDNPLPGPFGPNEVPYPRFELIGGETRLVGVGGDDLEGGPGIDTVSFEGLEVAAHTLPAGQNGDRIVGAIVNLATGVNNNAAATTTLSGFENMIGTDYGDDLTGDDGPNLFDPLHGGGYFIASTSGPDRVDGRGGEDTLRIDFSREDLPTSTGIQSLGFGNGSMEYRRSTPDSPVWLSDDTSAVNIEHFIITGASKDDAIIAGNRNYSDMLSGMEGNDRLEGYGGSDTLLGGDGNDQIFGLVFHTDQGGTGGASLMVDGNDFIDAGDGDDYVDEYFGGTPAPLHAADARLQLDGGTGFDILSVDFGNESMAIVWDSANPANIEFPDGAYARNFEQLRYFGGGGGDDVIAQRGRADNYFYLGDGDDTIDPGIGIDSIYGGPGSDLLILDFSVGDGPTSLGVNGGGPFTGGTFSRYITPGGERDITYAYDFERFHITGTSKDDNINGIDGPDMLFGGEGNDVLIGGGGFGTGGLIDNNYLDGGPGNDTLWGSGRVANLDGDDTLIGGDGDDILYGRGGSDVLAGGPGNDIIYGDELTPRRRVDGTDVVDAGDGDDFVSEFQTFGSSVTAAPATVLMLDGGPGFDTLSVDVSQETQPFIWDSTSLANIEFPSGSYVRNFEVIQDFIGTTGNDVVIQRGRVNNNIDTGAGDDVIDPGLGLDQINPGPGNNLLIFDFSVGDDANVGGLMYSAPTTIERHDLTSGTVVDQIRVFSGANDRYEITGTSKVDVLHGFGGADVLLGGAGDDSLDGGSGDDWLDGGTGADTMSGGSGNDTYRIDSIADVIAGETSASGNDTVRAVIDYTLEENLEILVLEGRAIHGTGNALANIITGNARSNALDGGEGDDVITGGFAIGLAGSREVDLLHGGLGADVFVLGDTDSRYYDDRSSLTPGTSGYARIDDFTPSAGDQLKLHGAAGEYFLGASPVAGVPGTGLFHDTNADAIFEPGYDELIAILDSPDALTHANTIDAALFV